MLEDQELLVTTEARRLLRVSKAKWCTLRRGADFVRPIRLGARSLRWRRSELLAYLETRREDRLEANRGDGPCAGS
jgi:predicted DNA-binding transcriptional regulator AlpA